jgi:hypothetical protein
MRESTGDGGSAVDRTAALVVYFIALDMLNVAYCKVPGKNRPAGQHATPRPERWKTRRAADAPSKVHAAVSGGRQTLPPDRSR